MTPGQQRGERPANIYQQVPLLRVFFEKPALSLQSRRPSSRRKSGAQLTAWPVDPLSPPVPYEAVSLAYMSYREGWPNPQFHLQNLSCIFFQEHEMVSKGL